MPDRAQSEVVGSVLVIGLVVVVVGIAGAAALGPVTSGTDGVRAEITGGVGTDELTLAHQGGDSLPGEDLRLIVRVNGSETSLDWADGTLSGGDDVFDSGEGWRVDRDVHADSVVAVTLIHEPSNTVLFSAERNPTVTESVAADRGGNVGARDSEGAVSGGANRGDDGNGADESITVEVNDLTYLDGDAPQFVVSYDVGSVNDSFDRVEVEFDGEEADDRTLSADRPRGSVGFLGDNGADEPYTITIRTYDDDGSVGRSRTITDRADTVDQFDGDLSESDSPTIGDDTTITDESDPETDDVQYRFDYEVETEGNFGGVVLGVVNRNGNGDTVVYPPEREWTDGEVSTLDSADGEETLDADYRAETEYKLTILVFDDGGAVVDTLTLFDEADGEGVECEDGGDGCDDDDGDDDDGDDDDDDDDGDDDDAPGNSGSAPGRNK